MKPDPHGASATADHYDKAYYNVHHGRFLESAAYSDAIGLFYEAALFSKKPLRGLKRVLDFGSGPGHLTSQIRAACYDPSPFIRSYLQNSGREFYWERSSIPEREFDMIFSSHSLEHCIDPASELRWMCNALRDGGFIVILLPLEKAPGAPTATLDDNMHFFTWTFQTITNLLITTGFQVVEQRLFYAPFGLKTLGQFTSRRIAPRVAHVLSRVIRRYPALLTIGRRQ